MSIFAFFTSTQIIQELVWLVGWCVPLCFLPSFFPSSLFYSLSVLFPPASPDPLRASWLYSPTALNCPLQFSYHPDSPTWTFNSPPLLFSKLSQAYGTYAAIADFTVFSLQVETSARVNQMGALKVSCEKSYCGASFIFSPLDVFPVTALHSERHQWPKFGKAC